MLRRKGYQVHVYDRYDRVGGLMIYGIPNFKLEKEVVRRRADLLERGGLVFHLNCDAGSAESFAALRRRHAAVPVAPGLSQPRDLQVPAARKGVVQGTRVSVRVLTVFPP